MPGFPAATIHPRYVKQERAVNRGSLRTWNASRTGSSTIPMMKPTRVARALATVLPAGAILMALPALAAAPSIQAAPSSVSVGGFITSSSILALDGSARTGDTAGHIKLAAKLSSTLKGAAVGSRAARGSNKSDERNTTETDQEEEKDAENQKSQPEADAPSTGPFKVVIPGQNGSPNGSQNSEQTPPPGTAAKPETAPRSASPAAASATPVRTILDRSAKTHPTNKLTDQTAGETAEIKPAATAVPAQQTALPASPDAADSGCIAGCYAPTSTQLTSPAGRRAASAQQAKAVPAAQNGIECLAGCDGIDGMQLPRATSGAADTAAAQAHATASQSGSNRVVIMRGNSRTKTYGVNQ